MVRVLLHIIFQMNMTSRRHATLGEDIIGLIWHLQVLKDFFGTGGTSATVSDCKAEDTDFYCFTSRSLKCCLERIIFGVAVIGRKALFDIVIHCYFDKPKLCRKHGFKSHQMLFDFVKVVITAGSSDCNNLHSSYLQNFLSFCCGCSDCKHEVY